MKNFIINLLDLKQEEPCRCPQCLKLTSKVKEYKKRKYVYQIINATDTYINYELRRMICPY